MRDGYAVRAWRSAGCLAACAISFACARAAPQPHGAHGDPIPAPDRAGELERLLLAVTEYQTCKGQVGRLVGISSIDASTTPVGDRPLIPVTGRLLLDRCVAARDSDGVHLSLAGRGWTSVHATKEVDLGALFAVDGLMVFSLIGELSASVRVAGSPSTLSVWLPSPAVSAFNFNLIRRPNVRPTNIRGQAGRVLSDPLK